VVVAASCTASPAKSCSASDLVALEALTIGLGADHQHVGGVRDLMLDPPRPALGQVGDEAVEPGVDALTAQALRQLEDARAVGLGVVAVADEDPRRR
jgi:hypothetical protein